jgi:hypothetical protein
MNEEYVWIREIRARGWGDTLSIALDVLEPLGAFGAQLLWIAQPLAGLVGGRALVDSLARALEEPGGIERLRQMLTDE